MRGFMIFAFAMSVTVFAGCDSFKNTQRHKAMEQNNTMVFMYRSINNQMQEWVKGKTIDDKRKAIEKLIKEVKDKRSKLQKMKVVKELTPIKELLDKYFATIEKEYSIILDSYKQNKESDVPKKVKELNARLKEMAQQLIALQEKAAKELGVKINRKMLTPMEKKGNNGAKPAKKDNQKNDKKGEGTKPMGTDSMAK